MRPRESTNRQAPSLMNDVFAAGQYYLGNRWTLLILAVVLIVAGAVFNWTWLVAVGIAPVLLSTLPCLLMCAFGACMMCKANKGPSPTTNDSVGSTQATAIDASGALPAASGAASCCNHEPSVARFAEVNRPPAGAPKSDTHA